jgi:hypothetical protein
MKWKYFPQHAIYRGGKMCNQVYPSDKTNYTCNIQGSMYNSSTISQTNHNPQGCRCKENVLTCQLSMVSCLLECTESDKTSWKICQYMIITQKLRSILHKPFPHHDWKKCTMSAKDPRDTDFFHYEGDVQYQYSPYSMTVNKHISLQRSGSHAHEHARTHIHV